MSFNARKYCVLMMRCCRDGRALVAAVGMILVGAIVMVMLKAGGDRWQPIASQKKAASQGRPLPEAGFKVFANDAQSCKTCHVAEFEDWVESHHAHANRLVNFDLDRSAFDPAQSVTIGSYASDFKLDGKQPVILTMGASGEREHFLPKMALAYMPLRQYLIPFPGGRWQATELAFDPERGDWFNVYGDQDRRPDEWGFWTNRGMNWNSNCASCHMTGYEKNYDIATDSYESKWNEMGVSCTQCHAGMDGHAEAFASGSIFSQSASIDPTLIMENCMSCHSRREELRGGFVPGDRYHDFYRLSLPSQPGLYYADGQILDEVFVTGSFLMSKMGGRAGVHCLHCHNPHSGRLTLPVNNNALCMSCHAPPTRMKAPAIEPIAHSFHQPDSTGNRCVECHMSQTTYMQRDPRRDHGFTSPDPLLTKELGIPNACNKCHNDQTVEWAIEWVDKWYGHKMERPERKRARLIQRAYDGAPGLGAELAHAAESEEIAAWQATLIELAGNYLPDAEVTRVARYLLDHESPRVRSAAVRVLGANPETVSLVMPLLHDPSRLVRLDASWAVCDSLDPESDAYKELVAYLENNADQPAGAARLGQFDFARGRFDHAEEWYRKSIKWDVHSVTLYHDLAIMQNTRGNLTGALQTLREALTVDGSNAQTHFMLGLLEAERGNKAAAMTELESAVALEPAFTRAWYNLGLLRAESGDLESAISALRKAEAANPNSPEPPFARATLHLRRGEHEAARKAAQRALDIDPDYQPAKQILAPQP